MLKQLLLLLVITPFLVLAGPVYKWVDEEGVVHFSSRPHHEAEDIETLQTPKLPQMFSTSSSVSEEADESSSEAAEDLVENDAPTPELIEYCKALNNNLTTLKSSPRVRMKKENGEFEILGDEARRAEMGRIENAIKESCQ